MRAGLGDGGSFAGIGGGWGRVKERKGKDVCVSAHFHVCMGFIGKK